MHVQTLTQPPLLLQNQRTLTDDAACQPHDMVRQHDSAASQREHDQREGGVVRQVAQQHAAPVEVVICGWVVGSRRARRPLKS